MQTFLPYPDFHDSVKCLDYRRLGKQRVECKQILNALTGDSNGWKNHPATLMWKGYEVALAQYRDYCISEWIRRGYKNTMMYTGLDKCNNISKPFWFGDNSFHSSHRSNLLRKDPEWYGQFNWTEPDNLPYVWPSKNL